MRCALIGEKLSHSYSRLIHKKFGMYSYDLVELPPDNLKEFVEHGGYDAFNVTIPYKSAIIPYIDKVETLAMQIGAINTVCRLGGKTYGYPWCRGGYFLFGAEGCDAAETRPDNTVIGSGPGGAAAAYLSGLPQGEYDVRGTLEAYTAFAGGKYSFLIGTQRDYWRLTSRELAFTAVPLTAFGDLWQYLFICAKDTGKYRGCIDFLAYLLSDEIQSTLSRIGMMSIRTSVYTDDGPLALAEAVLPARSASAFLSEEGSAEFAGSAFLAVKGDKSGAKKLENFLV